MESPKFSQKKLSVFTIRHKKSTNIHGPTANLASEQYTLKRADEFIQAYAYTDK